MHVGEKDESAKLCEQEAREGGNGGAFRGGVCVNRFFFLNPLSQEKVLVCVAFTSALP